MRKLIALTLLCLPSLCNAEGYWDYKCDKTTLLCEAEYWGGMAFNASFIYFINRGGLPFATGVTAIMISDAQLPKNRKDQILNKTTFWWGVGNLALQYKYSEKDKGERNLAGIYGAAGVIARSLAIRFWNPVDDKLRITPYLSSDEAFLNFEYEF